MRWIFYFLIIANITYFSWGFFSKEKNEATLSKAKEDKQIQLVSENEQNSQATDFLMNADSTDMYILESSEPEQTISNIPSKEQNTSLVNNILEASQTSKVSILPDSIEESSKTLMIDKLPNNQTLSLTTADKNGQYQIDLGCFEISNIDKEEAESLDLWSAEQNIESKTMEKTVEQINGYTVYYGPMETRQEALLMLESFKEEGIDSYLLTKDDLNNAIALGLYSIETNALKKANEFKLKGLDMVKIKPRVREKKLYSQVFVSKTAINKEILESEMANMQINGQIIEISCF